MTVELLAFGSCLMLFGLSLWILRDAWKRERHAQGLYENCSALLGPDERKCPRADCALKS